MRLIDQVFDEPKPRILIGGVYPTLIPEHADEKLRIGTSFDDDGFVVVDGEIHPDAANAWTDLSLYKDPLYSVFPQYAIITGGRGCPFNCAYCAQLKLNNSMRIVRNRPPEDIADEMEHKYRAGIREFAFYEDNLLFNKEDFLARLEAIRKRNLRISIYAPEGIEPRLVEHELMSEMRASGFKKIHLALETIDNDISKHWNRRQASIEKFDKAVDVLRSVGFKVGGQDMNAFVIFGLPAEDLQAVINTAVYASTRVGSVVPMLFTPVPGSILYETHKDHLREQRHLDGSPWDLQDYNGKLLPFLEFNQMRYPHLQASDYLEIEALMMHLNNSKVYQKRFDVNGTSQASRTFRRLVASVT